MSTLIQEDAFAPPSVTQLPQPDRAFPDAWDATGTFRSENEADRITIARIKVTEREVSYLWRAMLHKRPDLKLIIPMNRPFMNFKEARIQLGECLGIDPKKLKFEAWQGRRTFYPTPEQLAKLTEPKA